MSGRTFAQVMAQVLKSTHFNRIRRLAALRSAIGISAIVVVAAPMAVAQETCVSCSGPNAIYRCTVEKSEKIGRLGAIADKAIQTVCIRELARLGGHESCAVRKESNPAVCDGVPREIPLASLLDAAKAAQSSKPPVTPAALPAPNGGPAASNASVAAPKPVDVKPADPKAGPPRTVQEMAERTGASSKKQLDNVGDAASKTWDCVASFFTKC